MTTRSLLCRSCGVIVAANLEVPVGIGAVVEGTCLGRRVHRLTWGATTRSGLACDSCRTPIGAGEEACCYTTSKPGEFVTSWELGLITVSPRPVAAS